MPGPDSGKTFTCTCTRFCKGYKTGLSRATYYRHAPYRDSLPEFSASFQAFLQNSSAPGPSTGSNLAVDEHEDSQDDNGVSRILLFQNQKVNHLIFIYLYPSPI